jgi:hypothetical protein
MFNKTTTVAQSTSSKTPFVRRGFGLLAAAAAAVVALVGAPSAAHADDLTADAPEASAAPAPQRVFGLGTAFGGGVSAATAVSSTGYQKSLVGPALLLPTTEFQFFFPREYSLDVVVPLTNIIIVSKAVGGFAFTMDAFFNMNIGQGTERFVFGPGLGFSALASDGGSAGTLRLPAQIGLEVLTEKRGFGFKILARPWAEFGSGSAGTAVGGGLLGALVFSTYVTRDNPTTTASR